MAAHSSILAWKIPIYRGAWQAMVHEVTKSPTGLSDEAQHRGKDHVLISSSSSSHIKYFHTKKEAFLKT